MYYLDFYREESSNLFSSALLCYNKGESVKEKSEKSGRKAQTERKYEKERANGRACQKDNR